MAFSQIVRRTSQILKCKAIVSNYLFRIANESFHLVQRVMAVKPSIQNQAPRSYSHLHQRNSKSKPLSFQQTFEQKSRKSSNKILLDKILAIMKRQKGMTSLPDQQQQGGQKGKIVTSFQNQRSPSRSLSRPSSGRSSPSLSNQGRRNEEQKLIKS